MSFLDKFVDKEKVSQATIANPREVFYNILKHTSGSSMTRNLRYNIFYQVIAFRGVVEGVGTSTLVANTALAIANLGLTVCVIDTSMLAPVQDVLLKTPEAVVEEKAETDHLDWFDMPFTKKSPLHVSSLNHNISVLSFKGKTHTVIDVLSTNDSSSLVDIALTELHNKFDIILIDTCHELTEVNTACLQQAQQIIQVWNDSPTVLATMESFITNSITISCPLDKMRNVVTSKMVKDVIGNLDDLLKQYRLTKIATSYVSEEIAMLLVTGKSLWQYPSKDQMVIDYTNCIIDIVCYILNIRDEKDKGGTITSNDIMEGKVEGTLHKKLNDDNEEFNKAHPEVVIDRNPMGYTGPDLNGDGIVDGPELEQSISGTVAVSNDTDYNATMEDDIEPDAGKKGKKKSLFGKKKK